MNDIKNQQAKVVSVQEWVIALVVMFLPIVNVVMMLVWAFGSNTNPSKANVFKAQLRVTAVLVVLWLFLMGGRVLESQQSIDWHQNNKTVT